MAWTDYLETVQKIYIAYYQRPADPIGLVYWAQRLDVANGNLNEIIEAFANSPEAKSLYGEITEENIADVVKAIYQAAFNREPEEAGLQYYVNGFKEGKFTAATIMLDILNGARGDDLIVLQNKVTSAMNFTKAIDPELDGKDLLATYKGEEDAQKAREFLKDVGVTIDTVKTVEEAKAFIKEYIADEGDPLAQEAIAVGSTYILTDKQDTVTGTDQDDLIYGTGSTLQDFDVIDGRGGTDTFQFVNSKNQTYYPNISNVEVLKVRSLVNTTTVDLGNASGVQEIIYDKGTGNLKVQNIPTLTKVTVEGGQGSTFTLDFANSVVSGNEDSIELTLKDANLANLYLDGESAADTNGFETVNVTVYGDSKISGNLANDSASRANIKTVNISGDGKLTIDDNAANTYALDNVETIDASQATGNVTVDADPATLKSFKGGSGDDTLKLLGGNITVNKLSIDGGEGTDKVVVDSNSYDEIQDTSKVSLNNIEAIRLKDGGNNATWTLDASKLSNVSTFEVQVDDSSNDGNTLTVAISNVENKVNVVAVENGDVNDNNDNNDGVVIKVQQKATYSGTDDVLNLTVKNGEILNEVNADKFETINLASKKDATVTGSVTNKIGMDTANSWIANGLVVPEAKTIKLTGDQDLELYVKDFKDSVAGTSSYKATFDASDFTGDLKLKFNEAANQKITLGAGDDELTLKAGSLDKNDEIDGGDGTDTLVDTDVNITDGSTLNILNVEKLKLSFDNGISATQKFSLEKDSALTDLVIDLNNGSGAADENIEISGIADNVTALVKDRFSAATKNLKLSLASGADTLTVKFEDEAGGADYNSKFETNAKTLTFETKNANTDITINTLKDSSLETLLLKGAGDITVKATDGTSNLATLVADTSGAVVIGDVATKTGVTLKSDANVTLGAGNDSFVFDLADHKNVAIDAGNGTDTLYLTGSLSVGPVVIDLSKTDDQIIQINAASNTVAQKGFENVDASAITTGNYGIQLTGSDGANRVVGSAKGDDISVGKGADTVEAKGGNDTIRLGSNDSATDKVIFESTASANGQDTIYNFETGRDILNFSAFGIDGNTTENNATAATLLENSGSAYTTNPSAAVNIAGKILFLVDISGGQDITTPSGLAAALGDATSGEYNKFNMSANSKAIVLTASSNAANQTVHVFYVETGSTADDGTGDDSTAYTITEVAQIVGVDIDDFTPTDFIV